MIIKEAQEKEFGSIWPIFKEVIESGDTYLYPRDMSKEEAFNAWMIKPQKTYLLEESNQVYGTYYIKPNQTGGGSHVCNCGYMVSSAARGKGFATSMCNHSQQVAVELGFKAMQFNFVVSSNHGAVKLWEKLGFKTVGKLPKAFCHPNLGYIDALVMYKWLGKLEQGQGQGF